MIIRNVSQTSPTAWILFNRYFFVTVELCYIYQLFKPIIIYNFEIRAHFKGLPDSNGNLLKLIKLCRIFIFSKTERTFWRGTSDFERRQRTRFKLVQSHPLEFLKNGIIPSWNHHQTTRRTCREIALFICRKYGSLIFY